MAAPGISDCSITEMAETPTNHGSHLHVPAPSNAHGEWSMGETPPTRISRTQRRHARSEPFLQTLSTIDEDKDDPPLPPPIQHAVVDADIPPTWLTILRKLLESEDEKKSAPSCRTTSVLTAHERPVTLIRFESVGERREDDSNAQEPDQHDDGTADKHVEAVQRCCWMGRCGICLWCRMQCVHFKQVEEILLWREKWAELMRIRENAGKFKDRRRFGSCAEHIPCVDRGQLKVYDRRMNTLRLFRVRGAP